MLDLNTDQLQILASDIKRWGLELGFQQIGISNIDLGDDEQHLSRWLNNQFHGDMDYMQRHGTKRSHPEELVPGTLRVISARMDYWPQESHDAKAALADESKGYVARYALGRDYHKVLRNKLATLGERINSIVDTHQYRVFVDSGPVLEKALARNAGLGWIGKHTNLINRNEGSWFFLGELLTNLPLPIDEAATNHCGTCTACIDVCPTKAIIAPYTLDARRCISYLTIELRTSIPEEFRDAIGNRIYGCDDCQLFCPWNKFAKASEESDFTPRHRLDNSSLIELFAWTEEEFLKRTEGSAIRRIGYECWLRNIAIALGNTPHNDEAIAALNGKANHQSDMVREHVQWALNKQRQRIT
ncbi:MAG TPA: tRNA epoxyqueuosine(34) reductase QueG [Steroidobacteraceae bacterium]|nr:tRNA epoxyqueuosine(34) reductase QueG [Steroidobacteraceae bacterium]